MVIGFHLPPPHNPLGKVVTIMTLANKLVPEMEIKTAWPHMIFDEGHNPQGT